MKNISVQLQIYRCGSIFLPKKHPLPFWLCLSKYLCVAGCKRYCFKKSAQLDLLYWHSLLYPNFSLITPIIEKINACFWKRRGGVKHFPDSKKCTYLKVYYLVFQFMERTGGKRQLSRGLYSSTSSEASIVHHHISTFFTQTKCNSINR